MPFPVVPLALGLLGAGGQALTNSGNKKIAREQMKFQERMSSTSAQRAVKDYEAAGLNPALAYDRGASSPGGASANIGDVAGAGISSARGASESAIAREQSAKDLEVKESVIQGNKAQRAVSYEQAKLVDSQVRAMGQDFVFQQAVQPFQLRQQAVNALLGELQIPAARNNATLDLKLGPWRPALGDILHGAKAAGSLLDLQYPIGSILNRFKGGK